MRELKFETILIPCIQPTNCKFNVFQLQQFIIAFKYNVMSTSLSQNCELLERQSLHNAEIQTTTENWNFFFFSTLKEPIIKSLKKLALVFNDFLLINYSFRRNVLIIFYTKEKKNIPLFFL